MGGDVKSQPRSPCTRYNRREKSAVFLAPKSVGQDHNLSRLGKDKTVHRQEKVSECYRVPAVSPVVSFSRIMLNGYILLQLVRVP
jgi:hypothetical protein